jgi:hypothetical protein
MQQKFWRRTIGTAAASCIATAAVGLAVASGSAAGAASATPTQSLAATISGNNVSLSWTAGWGASYVIARDDGSADGASWVGTAYSGASSFVDSNVPAGRHIYTIEGYYDATAPGESYPRQDCTDIGSDGIGSLLRYESFLQCTGVSNSVTTVVTTTPVAPSPTPAPIKPPVAVDLAKGRPAAQSSDYTSAYTAAKAVDGNTSGLVTNHSVSITRTSSQPWWQVDLQGSHAISKVTLFNRDGSNHKALSNYRVLISDRPFNHKLSLAQQASQPGVWASPVQAAVPDPSSTVSIAAGVTGRYVMVALQGFNPLQLAEVIVQ